MDQENLKCKGARDLLPDDMEYFRCIEGIFIDSCKRWGYREVRTPTLEYLYLFTSAGTLTPAMLHKVYSFLDWDGWSGERIVLRPDGTIPVARLYIENLANNIAAKLFYVTNVFAFEGTGKENRERWQCGVEYLGNYKPVSDVELILLALEVLKNLNLDNVQIKLSHAGLLRSMLNMLDLDADNTEKLHNKIREGHWDYLIKQGGKNTRLNGILPFLMNTRGNSTGFLKNIKSLASPSKDMKVSIDNFCAITELLDAVNCHYQIDMTSTKDFEYYTGLCFKFQINNKIIGSGGRYNDLLPLMGSTNTPACGFAFYIDPILKLISNPRDPAPRNRIAIVNQDLSPQTMKLGFAILQRLHKKGYVAELDTTNLECTFRWIIKLNKDTASVSLTDNVNGKTMKLREINMVIDTIEANKEVD